MYFDRRVVVVPLLSFSIKVQATRGSFAQKNLIFVLTQKRYSHIGTSFQ